MRERSAQRPSIGSWVHSVSITPLRRVVPARASQGTLAEAVSAMIAMMHLTPPAETAEADAFWAAGPNAS